MRKLELFCSFQQIWLRATGHPDSGHPVPPGKEYRPIHRLPNQRSKDRSSQESSIEFVPIPSDPSQDKNEGEEVLLSWRVWGRLQRSRTGSLSAPLPPPHNGESWCDLAACARNLGTAPPSIFSDYSPADMPYQLRHPSRVSVSSHFLVLAPFYPALSLQIGGEKRRAGYNAFCSTMYLADKMFSTGRKSF